jgi:hypothetical protein
MAARTIGHVGVRPLARVFPKLAATVEAIVAAVKAVAWLVRLLWSYRVELVVTAAALWAWSTLTGWLGDARSAGMVLGIVVGVGWLVLAIPPAAPRIRDVLGRRPATRWLLTLCGLRQRATLYLTNVGGPRLRWGAAILWVCGSVTRARTRRRVIAGMRQLRLANLSGQLPKVRRVRSTAVGEQVILACRPGQSAELLDARAEELRAAARSRDVRITRDPGRSDRVVLDVVRRDPLAAAQTITWADLGRDVVSGWEPIHLGTDETGAAVRLSFVERGLFVGGEPGSGKSSAMQAVVCHGAKAPDVDLVLVDPNRVQFGPWRDRAMAFAADDPDDALAVLQLVQAEIGRRLDLLARLPGVQRKLTREIAEGEGLTLLYVLIDELAYHTSVIGTPTGPFAKAARDIVARGRAAGIVPVFGTQRPTSDVVPTSLRDLFSMRAAFRCTTNASSDVILGDGWARRGYTAVDIDITTRGVSWLLAEGQNPRKLKWVWVPDESIAELSLTTVANRPSPVPAPPVAAPISPAPAMPPRRVRRRTT